MRKMIGAGILLINSNNELLMLLRDNKSEIPFPNLWDIPGGQVESGETPEETVKREMLEEMDLEIGNINLFRTYESENLIDNVFGKELIFNPKRSI